MSTVSAPSDSILPSAGDHHSLRLALAALAVLLTLQVTMLAALLTLTVPHPPLFVAPFALGPFLGAAIALAVAAMVIGPVNTRFGKSLSVLASLAALVSFGPHKWFDPAFSQIWPAVVLAQLAIICLFVAISPARRSNSQAFVEQSD